MLLLTALAALLASTAGTARAARPVSYLGGTSLMLDSRSGQNEGMATYTLIPSLAAGIHAATFRYDGRDRVFATPTFQYLVHRWSEYAWQANLYAGGGYGLERSQGSSRDAGLASAEADWESRSLYVSARAESLGLFTGEPLTTVRGRAGFAAYEAETEGLHTWVLLQVDHRDWINDTSFTPMLRFFYKNVNFELGASLEGEWIFNWALEL